MTATAPLLIEENLSLKALNSFGVPARARALARITSDGDVRRVLDDARWGAAAKFVLGGGSNLLLRHDIDALVLKIEVRGMRIVERNDRHTIVEAGAGENWHDFVAWTLANDLRGLENLALIPGTVGASPVQNIGAYGSELQDFCHAVDAVDLITGRSVTIDAAHCQFAYRDSIFKRDLAGKSCITRVRFALPKRWQPVTDYRDVQIILERERASLEREKISKPTAQQLFDIVCAIRRAKLPDPAVLGNAGSFFKNPIVQRKQLDYVLDIDGNLVYYPLEGENQGRFKLAAGWLIDACGWKGKCLNRSTGAGVYDKQALVLVNRGDATGEEIWQLAQAVQHSVYQRFGVTLEPEPLIL
jgi:UDP-N-acetylmuramate dehydrogenase